MPTDESSDGPRTGGRRRWPLLLLGLAVLLVAAGVAGWFALLRNDSPERLALSDEPAGTPATTATAWALSGTWRVAPGSVSGYRIRETFAGTPSPSEAVGRTEGIVGQAVLEEAGDQVTVLEASFEADLLGLKSDKDRRDNAIKTRGIETSKFPKATFVLAQPATAPRRGGTVQAVGDLTLHGQTKRVTIPLAARLAGPQVELVGNFTFAFADFAMEPPSIGGFVSVEDRATLEVKLLLAR